MVEESGQGNESAAAATAAVSPATTATTETEKKNTWKLPDGAEDHVYSGLLKGAAGVTVGAAVGLLAFRSGKGWRAGAMAVGAGAAFGSTWERMKASSS